MRSRTQLLPSVHVFALAGAAGARLRRVASDAYFAAQLDTLGSRPAFQLHNPLWPGTSPAAPGRQPLLQGSRLHDSCVGAEASVESACVEQSVVGRQARVCRSARLSRSILLDRAVVSTGARLRNVTVDRANVIPPAEVIGHDQARDCERFPVSPGGVVVVPRGYFAGTAPLRTLPRMAGEPQPLLHG